MFNWYEDGAPSFATTAIRGYGPRLRGGDSCFCGTSYSSRRVELAQFFNDDQTLRESRKESTGVDEPSASKRCSSTPIHWNPHFSSTLRDAGLATRAPAQRCSAPVSSKPKSMAARAASVPKP